MRARVRPLIVPGLVLVAAAIGGLSFGTTAGAVTGHAGSVLVSVTPTSRVIDGEVVAIHAQAPSGVAIYQITAHLCLPGRPVRLDFDFGFQGQRCTNAAVGGGDVEQSVDFASGAPAGSLDTFRVGQGSVRWVNELGYPATLQCGPGRPCDLVVRVQITGGTVFFNAPLCYGSTCAAEPTTPTTTKTAAPSTATGHSKNGSATSGSSGSADPAPTSSAARPRGSNASANGSDHSTAGGHGVIAAGPLARSRETGAPAAVVVESHPIAWSLGSAAAGAIGGAAIVLILGRARRRPIFASARRSERLETA